jgi:hypothetical protein
MKAAVPGTVNVRLVDRTLLHTRPANHISQFGCQANKVLH